MNTSDTTCMATVSSSAVELTPDTSYSQTKKWKYVQRKKIVLWLLLILGLVILAFFIAVIVLNEKLKDALDENDRLESLVENGVDTTPPSRTKTTPPPLDRDILLPTALRPYLYEVEIRPNIYIGPVENFTFVGYTKIYISCDQETQNITIHSRNLEFNNESIAFATFPESGSEYSYFIEGYTHDTRRDFVVFYLNRALVAGQNYTLSMNFSGDLKNNGFGFYWSEYKVGNESRYVAATQFQANHARAAFPCFDQPDYKATFDVNIIRRRDYISLSNMPLKESINRSDDFVVDVFHRSVVMPSYLVAFLVCDYEHLEKPTSGEVKVRTWSRQDKVQNTRFALDVAVRATEWNQDYLQINTTLPKQDHATVPLFEAGAMENWGLFKYKESMLMYNPLEDTQSRKFLVNRVVLHEIAHIWFGNLVTCKWWNDLWLNEGFSSYFETLTNIHLHNEWRPYDMLLVITQDAMDADNVATSRPLIKEVWKDFDSTMFDTITYGKGVAIVRQLHFLLGDGTFQRALKRYLNAHAFGNTATEDLMYTLTKQMSEDKHTESNNISDTMNAWIRQNNYPVVTVSRLRDGSVVLTQHRHLKDQINTKQDDSHRWYIPFTYTTNRDTNFAQTYRDITWMRPNDTEVIISNQDGHLPTPRDGKSWIIGNVGVTGFYRLNYDNATWSAIAHQLQMNHTIIDPRNRAQLINDAWKLSYSKDLEIEHALDITDYIHKDIDYIPWHSADKELRKLDKMLRHTKHYGIFQKYMLSKVENVLGKLGMVNTDIDSDSKHLEIELRSLVMSLACKYGNTSCVKTATDLFNDWIRNMTERMDPNLRRTIYCTAVREIGERAWEQLYAVYKTTKYPTERSRLLYGLSCANELWLVHKFVNKILGTNEIDVDEQADALGDISNNPIGREVVMEAVVANWDKLKSKPGFNIGSTFRKVAVSFNSPYLKNQVEYLIQKYPREDVLTEVRDSVMENMKWMSNFSERIVKWMESKLGI